MSNSLILLIIYCNLAKALEPSDLLIITSKFTFPDHFLHPYNFPNILNISDQNFESLSNEINRINFLLIVDMTNSTIYSPIINLISTQFECAYISPFFNSASTDFRFFMHPNLNSTVQSINNLISFIQMKQIYLLCSSNSDDLQICDGLMEINSNFKEIICALKKCFPA